MKRLFGACIFLVLIGHSCTSPNPRKYIFYLHGGIVQEEGEYAVSELFGPYQYLPILDSLRKQGYTVISERRPKGTEEKQYATKVAMQIDSLIGMGVSARSVVVVGASQGAGIALEASNILKNREVNFALLGICNEYNMQYYSKYADNFCGRFLSIYERSDQKLSCNDLLKEDSCVSEYTEVALSIGNGHAFLYKPYPEWMQPLVAWIDEVKEVE